MKIKTIREHKVAVDLLPEKALVLDLGCRGFAFTDHMRERGHTVLSVDADRLDTQKPYYQCAIWNKSGVIGLQTMADPNATHVVEDQTIGSVEAFTMLDFSKHVGVAQWDLIKMDIEGAEREVIESWSRPWAKQLSIEFHLHCPGYFEPYVDKIVDKLLSLGYVIASHEKTREHGAGLNYWSSLFVLKDEKSSED